MTSPDLMDSDLMSSEMMGPEIMGAEIMGPHLPELSVTEEVPALPLSQRFEQVEPAVAALRRLAFCGRNTVRFDFGNAPFALRFIDRDTGFEPAAALLLQVGTAQGWLLLESYDMFGEEWARIFERLDPMLARALLIEESSRLAAQLAVAGGEAVQLLKLQIGQPFLTRVPTLALRVENESAGIGVRAALRSDDPRFFSGLANALARCTPRRGMAPADARLPLRMSPGRIWLRRSEAAETHSGDVLLLPATGTPADVEATCIDRHGARLPLRARLQGKQGKLTIIEGETMVNDVHQMQAGQEGTASLDDLAVPLTAVIGELELPLHAVGSLQAGYVFELPVSVDNATVQLYTGSRRVGSGLLVAIGDRLGVRLVEWKGAAHGNHAA